MYQLTSSFSVLNCPNLHCHCGTVRYTITISPPLYAEHSAKGDQYPAVECACSWCQRNGEICVHPLSKNVKWTHGEDHRGEYYFGKKIAPHWFCKTCASTLGGDMGPLMKKMGMEERMTINVSPRAWLVFNSDAWQPPSKRCHAADILIQAANVERL